MTSHRTSLGLGILWIVLLSPLLIWPTCEGAPPLHDALAMFCLATSLLWLTALHCCFRRPVILHLGLFPFYLTTCADLFLLANFDARLTSGYVFLALSDHADATEMLATYWRPIAMVVGCVGSLYATGLCLIRNARVQPRPRLAIAALILLSGAYAAVATRAHLGGAGLHRSVMDLAQKEIGAPVGVIWQTVLAADILYRSADSMERREQHSFDARIPSHVHAPEVVVLVLGESSRPQSWSLFGHIRDTTPLLRTRQDTLIPFRDLFSTAPHTAFAIPSLLSLRPIEQWDLVQSEASITKAFEEAGFATTWLSAQSADSWAGLMPAVAREAMNCRYRDHAYDGALVEELGEIVAQSPLDRRQFVVLHTKGSHFDYSRRYPEDFDRFAPADDGHAATLRAHYENSILYTDWVLDKVIETMRASGRSSVVLFVSDHGENVLDDERGYFGHALGTEYDIRTAGFAWLSDELAFRRAHEVTAARTNADRPMTLSDLSHSLLHLVGVEARGLDRTRSVFDPGFQPRFPRRFIVRGELRDESSLITTQQRAELSTGK